MINQILQDGAKYDRNGNRIQYANANANANANAKNADRRSEQVEPEPEQVAVDLPRQQFNYQKPANQEVFLLADFKGIG